MSTNAVNNNTQNYRKRLIAPAPPRFPPDIKIRHPAKPFWACLPPLSFMNTRDQHLVILLLEYSQVVNANLSLCYESNNGLWQPYKQCETLVPNLLSHTHGAYENYRIIDNLGPLRRIIGELNNNGLSASNHVKLVEPQLNSQLITVSINGNETFINNSRLRILAHHSHIGFKKVVLSDAEFAAIKELFIIKLNELSSAYNVEVLLNNIDTDFRSVYRTSQHYAVYIAGNQDSITLVESKVRILVDTLLHSFYVDLVEVPLSLIPILGGIELNNFSEIVRQLNANIYVPDLMPELFNLGVLAHTGDLRVWFTAQEAYQNTLTKSLVNSLISTIQSHQQPLVVRRVELQKVKIDLLALYSQTEVLNIMFQHGTFVQLPSLGTESKNYSVMVQGQSVEAVNETVLALALLSAEYYSLEMDFQASASTLLNDFEFFLLNLVQLQKTCVVTHNLSGITINGHRTEIKQVLASLVNNSQTNYYFGKGACGDLNLRMTLELNNGQRDFISGKKNGKIIKILGQLGNIPTIRFSPFNECNFLINLAVDSTIPALGSSRSVFDVMLKSIQLLELELPAELQFNIPEVFHKLIIGNGGSIIQLIMKKYNVFIKFSSSGCSSGQDADKLFYSFKRTNNVLIKCPLKNAQNIMLVKYEIDQMVQQCCNNSQPISGNTTVYQTVNFRLLKSHYLMMLAQNKHNLKFISGLETETNAFVDFPSSLEAFESNVLTVAIKGSDSKSRLCAAKLRGFLPNNYEFKVTYCPGRFGELLQSSHFEENIVVPLRLLLGIELVANEVPLQAAAGSQYHQIILSYYGNEGDRRVQTAISELTLYLREKKFLILDKQTMDFNPIVEPANDQPLRAITRRVNNNGSSPNKKSRSPQKQMSGYAYPVPVALAMPPPVMNSYAHYIS